MGAVAAPMFVFYAQDNKAKDERYMPPEAMNFYGLEYAELEVRFGQDNAHAILRTLEQFEGISEMRVREMSKDDRMRNVMAAMKDSIRYQPRH